jgi:5-methylcytosine-specific restriction endonuclease McrA
MEFETTRCVVLNSTYEPISIITSKRALLLILEGKAIIVEEHPHMVVRSPKQTFKVPLIVALKMFVKGRKIFRTTAALSQRNLFIRDNYICQYCARTRSELRTSEFLTRDHVIPECKGGKSTWDNLVTACSTCNNKKAANDLENINMTLLKKPTAPTLFELWMKTTQKKLSLHHITI